MPSFDDLIQETVTVAETKKQSRTRGPSWDQRIRHAHAAGFTTLRSLLIAVLKDGGSTEEALALEAQSELLDMETLVRVGTRCSSFINASSRKAGKEA